MSTNKKYYKRAIQMAWPSVLESFFVALAGMIDTIMVGSLGSFAIAAVGLTTQPKFIGMTAFFAINIAVSALVARRLGERDKRGANTVFHTAALLTIGLTILISFIMVYFSDSFMRWAGSNNETHQSAVVYFRIIMGGMIFNVVAMVINTAQRGAGNTQIAFVTNLTSSIVNIVANYILINGKLGFPALGVQGAAIATVFGTVVAMLMSIASLFKKDSSIQIKYIISEKIKFSMAALKSIAKLGSNLFLENIAVRIGFLATALTAAKLGTDTFAVHMAGMNILSLGFSFGDGMQVAAVALTGRALGGNNKDEAFTYGHVVQRIGFIISIALSIFLLIFGPNIMGLYFDDPQVINLGVYILRYTMIIVLLQISQIIYGGALRSGGDVKYTLVVGIVAVTLIRTAVTLVAVHVFELGLTGIWLGILADQLTRFILLRHRFNTGKWTEIKI